MSIGIANKQYLLYSVVIALFNAHLERKEIAMEKILFRGCDITLAVRQQMLITEARPDEECQKEIWLPTKGLLIATLKKDQDYLTCSRGLAHPCQKGGGLGVDVNFVTSNKEVAYLCTVVDRKEAKAVWRWHVVKLKKFGRGLSGKEEQRLITLKTLGWKTIIRETFRLSVPVYTDNLDEENIEKGVRQYLSQFLRDPLKCKIMWVARPERDLLEKEILEQAERIANSNLTRKNTLRVIRRNRQNEEE